MGSQFWWFYDILAVALALFIIYLNAKRGFKKNFLITIKFSSTVLLSYMLIIIKKSESARGDFQKSKKNL